MPVTIVRLSFTEKNDARPTYVCAAVTAFILTLGQIIRQASVSHDSSIYIAGTWLFFLTVVLGSSCVMGCIWHPIPRDRRSGSGMTTLGIEDLKDKTTSTSEPMFTPLDEKMMADDEESVDMALVELRDHLQWGKMGLILACFAIDVFLIVIRIH
jgi:hypothetical protein